MARKKPIIALVDADYLEYAAGFAGQHTYYLLTDTDFAILGPQYEDKRSVTEAQEKRIDEGHDPEKLVVWERTQVEPIENVLHSCKKMLQRIEERVREKFDRKVEMRLFLTGSGNFRERIATIRPYKGNRKPWHKPRLQPDIRQYLRDVWKAEVIYGQEADDEVCILQMEFKKAKQPSVICGIDKDLLQCPGWHYDANKDKFANINPTQGDVLFYKQLLTGDTTDNIPGCYKTGAKAASDIILAAKEAFEGKDKAGLCAHLYAECVRQYQESIDKYGDKTGYDHMAVEDVVLENGRLLWMRREREQMWEPPI